MSSIKEKYQIGSIMKLIDLNKDTTNFDLSFQVTAENGNDFEMAIFDQSTLDEGDIKYQKIQDLKSLVL